MKNTAAIPLADKFSYGVGNFATGVAMQILGTYLVFYSTAILGLPGTLIGTIMGFSILWDAITDPVMGYISDRTGHRGFGRRHPYIAIGAIGIGITNYLVWNIDIEYTIQTKLILLILWVFLFKSFLTIYVTPYTALGAELSTDYNERTWVQGIKSIFFVLGLGFVSVAGLYWFFPSTPDYPTGQLNPDAYSRMAAASSIVIIGSALITFFPTLKYVGIIRTRNLAFPHKNPGNLFTSLQRTFKNQPFRRVVLAYMFSNLASALFANMGLIVFTYTFGLGSSDIALIIGIQFFFAMMSQPYWAYHSRKKGKRKALAWGFGLSLFGALYFTLLAIFADLALGNPWAFLPFSISAGAGIGALFTLPLSMVADTVDLDEARGGERIEGVYFGALTFVYKFTQAIALIFIGIVLDLSGFSTSLVYQSTETRLILGFVLGIGAALSFCFALYQAMKYKLTEEDVHACRDQIRILQSQTEQTPLIPR